MAKKAQASAPVAGSKKSQMKAFVAAHKGETFTASGLAKALGWIKKKIRKVKGEDGKTTEDVSKISHNAKSAVRLAKKCGARVSYKKKIPREEKAKVTPNQLIGCFTIVL